MVINVLGLDVGRARIGLAQANSVARIAAPLPAVANDEAGLQALLQLVRDQQIQQLVVGLPRGLDGQETQQTTYARDFTSWLGDQTGVPVVLQDEAVTSVQAEAELKARGANFSKADIDSLSAVYILEDYLQEGVH